MVNEMSIGLFNSRICPKCGSTNLKSSTLLDAQEISRIKAYTFQMSPNMFFCENCNYFGICPEVDSNDIKQVSNNLKKIKKNSKNKNINLSSKEKTRNQKIAFMSKFELFLLFMVIFVFILAQFLNQLKLYSFVAIILFVIYIIIAHKVFSSD